MRQTGRARVDIGNLDAFAMCDRCGMLYNRSALNWQFDWAGPRLMNKRILVCNTGCMDRPFQHHRPIVVPPDPIPVANPRPNQYLEAMNNPIAIKDSNRQIMNDGQGRTLTVAPTDTYQIPPYPFSDWYMLRAVGGSAMMIMVRDDAYAVQVRNDVQATTSPGAVPKFTEIPNPNPPNSAYNNLNLTTKQPNQSGDKYNYPVILPLAGA